jgi:hypothetical protein
MGMGSLDAKPEPRVGVSRKLLAEAIKALRLGCDAVLDRDWDCYSASERLEAERYATATFTSVAQQLEQILDSQSSNTEVSSERSFRRS